MALADPQKLGQMNIQGCLCLHILYIPLRVKQSSEAHNSKTLKRRTSESNVGAGTNIESSIMSLCTMICSSFMQASVGLFIYLHVSMSSPALNLERGRIFKAEAPWNLIHLNLTREHLCVLVVCMRMNRQSRRKPQICPERWRQITVSSTTYLLLLCTDTCFNSKANIVSKHCFQLVMKRSHFHCLT